MAKNKNQVEASEALKEENEIDISVLFNEDTSDEAKAKVKTIFEAAVQAKAAEMNEAEVAKRDELVAEEVAAIAESFVADADKYLSYVAEKFLEKNQIAIESAIMVERAESILEGVSQLVAGHGMKIESGTESVVENLVAKLDQLSDELNEAHRANISLSEELEQNSLETALTEASRDMAETSAKKFRSLAEGIRYSDVEDFKTKIADIKATFFKESSSEKKNPIDEETITESTETKTTVVVDPDVEAIANAMKSKLR